MASKIEEVNMKRLPNRVAIVTGAAGGLGRAAALRLAEEGALLVLVDRAPCQEILSSVLKRGVRAIAVEADITSSEAIAGVVERALSEFGRIEVLINIAGISSHGSSDEVTEELWEKVLRGNLTSVFLFCKAVLPSMRQQRYGRIVSISSVLSKHGGNPRPWIDPAEQKRAGNLAYGAAKAGVNAMTFFLAKENASYGITANVIAPGPIATHMTRNFSATLQQLIPMGRMGTPEEVADAIAYLAGDAAGYVTGEVHDVNGGLWVD